MAPTGRASLILSQMTENQASTIHRKIYTSEPSIATKVDDNDFKTYFTLKSCEDPTNTIYFINESSMVSDIFSENEAFIFGSGFLLHDLLLYCNLKDTGRKIDFVGDYAQLPPVGQHFSPALDAQYLSEKYNLRVKELMMREVVRQKETSGIYRNASLIRDSIEAKHFNEFSLRNNIDICKIDTVKFLTKYFAITEKQIDINTIVIAYSNRQTVDYNTAIREVLFNTDNRIVEGELVLVTRNNYHNQVELFNGTIVKIEALSDTIENIEIELKSKKRVVGFRDVDSEGYGKYKIIVSFLTDINGALSIEVQKALFVNFKIRMWKEGIFYNSKHVYTYAQPQSIQSDNGEFVKFIKAIYE